MRANGLIISDWIQLLGLGAISASLLYIADSFSLRVIILLAGILIGAYISFHSALTPPSVYFSKTPFNDSLLEAIPSLSRSSDMFTPYFFLANPHLQTIGVKRRSSPRLTFVREEIDFKDGGAATLDWTQNPNFEATEETPTVLVLHGLVGGSNESYVRGFIAAAQKMKWRTVVFNFRGAAGSKLKSAMLYSIAFTGDLRHVVEHLEKKLPKSPLLCVGYSMGANVLVKVFCSLRTSN
eukprot:TRINITY_DN7086_c0_g1_i1.p1 TRINITY_DN7086_c0_g1~~TRINITY_DN7086_c0_g1_i1.p1  ORF type:complete len:238 (-),score=18.25 TRINITY_DN7086_c0_g1_i1:464-1177(-)